MGLSNKEHGVYMFSNLKLEGGSFLSPVRQPHCGRINIIQIVWLWNREWEGEVGGGDGVREEVGLGCCGSQVYGRRMGRWIYTCNMKEIGLHKHYVKG